MQGLRFSKRGGWIAAVFGCLLLLPALAQAQNLPAGATSFISDYELGDSDPAIKNAMQTLPNAMADWKKCYAGCMQGAGCGAGECASDCEQQVVALGYSASQTSEMLRYNVMGIYGAQCIGDFRKYIQTLQDAAKKAHTAGLSLGNILAQVIVDQILDAVIGQILNNLTNQICNVTNQLTDFADGVVNSICVPNININPFNFNLNIKNLSCDDGFSINPLTGQVNGSPINGISVPINNIYGTGTDSYNGGSGTNPNPVVIEDTLPVPTSPVVIDPIVLPNISKLDTQ